MLDETLPKARQSEFRFSSYVRKVAALSSYLNVSLTSQITIVEQIINQLNEIIVKIRTAFFKRRQPKHMM